MNVSPFSVKWEVSSAERTLGDRPGSVAPYCETQVRAPRLPSLACVSGLARRRPRGIAAGFVTPHATANRRGVGREQLEPVAALEPGVPPAVVRERPAIPPHHAGFFREAGVVTAALLRIADDVPLTAMRRWKRQSDAGKDGDATLHPFMSVNRYRMEPSTFVRRQA
jgi:hypothetical protein